jgi:UDP-glucose 4-epimerase
MMIDGAKILVTGGCGLIGSATIDQLLREHSPARIIILDNLVRGSLDNVAQALKDPRVTLIRGDIRDREAVRQAMAGVDALIHMAALRITACAAEPREAMEVMCDGTFNVIEAAHLAGVKKVVAASSASIYGLAESYPTREDHHPYNNQTWYGTSKVMLEGLLRSFHSMYGLPYVALRYFNVYGPRMDIHGKYTEVLIRWMERIAAGQAPLIFGDGNVASATETSLRDLAATLLQVMKSNLAPEFGPERSVNPVSRRLASTEKAERLLGFKAKVGLHDGLHRLVQWWQASREMALQA